MVRLPRGYAYRYVRVDVLDTSPNYGVRFDEVSAVAVTSARGAPPPLSALAPAWVRRVDEVSIATLRDCMQTALEDGPRRHQRLWIGDLRLQARASDVTYPQFDLVKRCLYLFAALPRASDGFLPACIFEEPTPATTGTFILDYAALYGAIRLDYVRASGDRATALDLWPVALRQLELLLMNVDSSGLFVIPQGSWAFIDWNRELDGSAPIQAALRQAVLQDEGAVQPTTAYLYHHVVEAMIQCGLRREALELVRGYWGLVEDGADTFWEAFDPKNSLFSPYGDVHSNSFCHAWSCTPTYFFRAHNLTGA